MVRAAGRVPPELWAGVKHDGLPAGRGIDGSYRIERPNFGQWLQRRYQLTRQSLTDNPYSPAPADATARSHQQPPLHRAHNHHVEARSELLHSAQTGRGSLGRTA